jgi:type VI secretion system protein VasD
VSVFRLRAAASAGLVAALAACSSPPKPPPPVQLAGSIQTSDKTNPNQDGRASPLMLRVYELKSVAQFNGADFMSLFQRDQAELGGEMVARDEYMVGPGETRAFLKTLSPDTHFLGVVAAYRDLDHATWRGTAAVDPKKNQLVVIHAERLAVDLSVSTVAR